MYGVGFPELILILVVALLVFGAARLPEVGRSLGKALKEFKKGMEGITGDNENKDSENKNG